MCDADTTTAHPTSTRHEATAQFLGTGEYDPHFAGWRGGNFIERARHATADLKAALIAEIRRRAPFPTMPPEIRELDLVAFTRRKLMPMVSGFFAEKERAPVLKMFDHAVVFLTSENYERIIAEARWPHTAWNLANLYLESVDASPFGDRSGIVGLSEEITCYVSLEYFAPGHRFADFVVHEAAHVFHNCKRDTIGLPETRRREWLLDIAYRKRETFAYACEAYSRILELAKSRSDRLQLVEELAQEPPPSDDRVDPDEYIDVLGEAAAARNGWKRILVRCHAQRSAG